MRRIRFQIEVRPGIWFVEGPASNWVILTRADAVALIDAGYPADAQLVEDSIRAAGRQVGQLHTVFLTHAHTDHLGAIPTILDNLPNVRVLCAAAELDAARDPVKRDQITFAKAGIRRIAQPRFLRWMLHAIRSGGLQKLAIPTADAFTADDLTEWNLTAVPLPGHTIGSTAYRRDDVLITGDAYVTDHATYAEPRTGAIDPVFSTDASRAEHSASLVTERTLILPGHGPASRDHRSV